MPPASVFQARKETLDQAMNTLRNRVNELGVSEAVVQQQGESRVLVDLPGIQDTAEAKNILGKTATLEFHMVDIEHDASIATRDGVAPPDTRLFSYHEPTHFAEKPNYFTRFIHCYRHFWFW